MTKYLQSDPELSTINLTPRNTIESPSSSVSQNCSPIVYPPFYYESYTGLNELDGVELNIADYETDEKIESTQVIKAGALVDYDSNSEIFLKAGFEVDINACFYAFIDGCNNGFGGLN